MNSILGLQGRFSLNDCDYSYWSQGSGFPIILLHGWPVTSHHWASVVPLLVEKGYATHCIDLRGLGESNCSGGNFSKKQLASEILQVIEFIIGKEAPFAVIGHDWGGSVALALTILSSRVKCLVFEEEIAPGLSATIPEPGASRYPTWHGGFHRQKQFAEKMIAANIREYFNFFLELRARPDKFQDKDRELFLYAYSEVSRLPVFLEYYRTSEEDSLFFKNMASRPLRTPVLAIGGKFAMGHAVAESLHHVCEDVSFKLLMESAHYPAQEEPRIFTENVVEFLSQNQRKT